MHNIALKLRTAAGKAHTALLPKPRLILQLGALPLQPATNQLCWACSLESWLSATPLQPQLTVPMLYAWGVMRKSVDPTSGAILVDPTASDPFGKLKVLLSDPLLLIRMQTSDFRKATDVSDAYGAIFDELIHGNYVYFVFKHYDTWHTVVAYDGDDDGLFVMDPFMDTAHT